MFMVRASDYPDLPMYVTDDPKVFHFERMPRANREDAIVLSVLRNRDIFLGYTRSSVADLPTKFEQPSATVLSAKFTSTLTRTLIIAMCEQFCVRCVLPGSRT